MVDGIYIKLQKDIFSVFSATAWTTLSIKTYPANTIPVNPGTEYIRVSIIPSGEGANRISVSGVLLIDIFVAFGNGPKRISELADILDIHLRNRYLTTNQKASTQFQNSSLRETGKDPDNAALYRAIYQIPFNYFGVT